MSDFMMFFKEYWGLLIGIMGVFLPIFWLALDSKYASKSEFRSVRHITQENDKKITQLFNQTITKDEFAEFKRFFEKTIASNLLEQQALKLQIKEIDSKQINVANQLKDIRDDLKSFQKTLFKELNALKLDNENIRGDLKVISEKRGRK